MPESLTVVLEWTVPAVVVLFVSGLIVGTTIWVVRRAHRSPRARAAAERQRAAAGVDLVGLDDAVGELDLEVGLSGALYGGQAPNSLRRARMTAQHVRDQEFAEFRDLSAGDLLPAEVVRRSERIRTHVKAVLEVIDRARGEHREWMRTNVSAAEQLAVIRAHLAALRAQMGDPGALVRELSSRFAETEWRDAADAARDAMAGADAAELRLNAAAADVSDPSRTALPDLAEAERSLRAAQADSRTLEETHRLVMQAAQALPGEFEAIHSAIRLALTTRESLEPADGDRLAAEVRSVEASLAGLEAEGGRRPTWAVDRIARLRDRLDLALGDARTAQQRIRGARTALPGTLAAARNAVAHAEASFGHTHAGADARVRLAAAQDELASARDAQDPVAALDAARRAIRHAEDAKALADYARSSPTSP